MRNNLEASHQKVIFEWAEWNKNKYPELDMLFHITNEGKRSKRMGAELKRMGLKKGIPDICLPVSNKEHSGLFIELKADKSKRLTKEQKEWLEKLNRYGYKALRCDGADEAIEVIKDYLNIK